MYAQINQTEITELATKKASGLATQIYLVLASHCWKKNECFPSLARISKMLGDVYHTNSIHRALKWLEDNGFIVRKAVTATNRFVMKVRSLTKRRDSNKIGEHKRKRKRRNNQDYSNHRQKNKSLINQPVPESIKRIDKAQQWLEGAMGFIFGDTTEFNTKGSSKDVRSQITGGHCAAWWWEDIQKKCGHLLS